MTLYEYLRDYKDDEVEVADQDYDVLAYFYYADEREEEADSWNRAMMQIARKLEVVESGDAEATVNLSEVIENNLDNGVFDDLFIHNDIDSIMDDINSILSGNVSEQWLDSFANSLK